MKINWGTGIVIAFVAFIAFIMYFIISMSVNNKYNHDLVTEDYYKQELEFQNEINKLDNATTLKENLNCTKTNEGLTITFPNNFNTNQITGKVFLYRPSNKHFDFEMPINLTNHQLVIPNKLLLSGRWNLKVDWQYQNKAYLFKKEIVY